MVRVSSPGKLRPWSELTAKMAMGVGDLKCSLTALEGTPKGLRGHVTTRNAMKGS